MFAVLQGESNKVIRELWTLVKNALNDISANVGQEEEYQAKPMMNNNEMPPYILLLSFSSAIINSLFIVVDTSKIIFFSFSGIFLFGKFPFISSGDSGKIGTLLSSFRDDISVPNG